MSILKHFLKTSHCSGFVQNQNLPLKTVITARQLRISQKTQAAAEDDRSKPVIFSTSPASKQTIFVSIPSNTKKDDMPWHHPWASVFSIAAFLIYFLALREENDIDEILAGKSVNQESAAAKLAKLNQSVNK